MLQLSMIGLFGLSGSGKSWKAVDRLFENQEGIFFTFKGIPPDYPKKVPALQAGNSDILAKVASQHKIFQVLVQDDLIWYLKACLEIENKLIVIDDIFVLFEQTGDIAGAKNIFDSFVKQARQKNIRIIITSHRVRKELSIFCQENLTEVYWVGPCSSKKTRTFLLEEISNIDISEEKFHAELPLNPIQTEYLIRKL